LLAQLIETTADKLLLLSQSHPLLSNQTTPVQSERKKNVWIYLHVVDQIEISTYVNHFNFQYDE
jgi:hypothetical protein